MANDRRQQWLRGVLDLCVLATLGEQERHGYAIASRLGEAGLAGVKGGTLYPLLARLQAAGHVTARWEPGEHGPGRKYYALAGDGRALLREQGLAWVRFARMTEQLIDPTEDIMTTDRTYLDQLEHALVRRGLDPSHTGEVIAEISDHLAESGDRPLETFGPAEEYAAALVAADQPEGDPEQRYEARTFRATAADEVEILADLGRGGWELTGVRDFGLHARRPVEPEARTTWEYARRTGVRREPLLGDMEVEGWRPCGRWVMFHYFKRPQRSAAGVT